MVAHGYSADQQIMSPLARSLAKAGYAVLTFDFRGHGSNTTSSRVTCDSDFDTALDWVTTSPYVDPRASPCSATRWALVPPSTSARSTHGRKPSSPSRAATPSTTAVYLANVLFLRAAPRPGQIKDRQKELAAQLDGKTNVQSVVISGTDHVAHSVTSKTVRAITSFLDPVMAWPLDARGPRSTRASARRCSTSSPP